MHIAMIGRSEEEWCPGQAKRISASSHTIERRRGNDWRIAGGMREVEGAFKERTEDNEGIFSFSFLFKEEERHEGVVMRTILSACSLGSMSNVLCKPLRAINEMRGREVWGEGMEREKGGHNCWAILCICVASDLFGAKMTATIFSDEVEVE